jgi:hypothetical protein
MDFSDSSRHKQQTDEMNSSENAFRSMLSTILHNLKLDGDGPAESFLASVGMEISILYHAGTAMP